MRTAPRPPASLRKPTTNVRLSPSSYNSGSLDYAVSLDGLPLSSWRCHEELGPKCIPHAGEKNAPSKPGTKHLATAFLDVVPHRTADADAAGLGEALETRRDIDTVAQQIAAAHEDVAEI